METEEREYLIEQLATLGRHTQELIEKLRRPHWYKTEIDELLAEAVQCFRRGDKLDGLTAVERALLPKWDSVRDSEIQYWTEGVSLEFLLASMKGEAA